MTNRIEIEDAMKWGMYAIIAHAVDGSSWILKHRFNCDDPKFRPTLERIRQEGSINPAHWRKSEKSL